ncbi:hypothetical protein [Archangium sp.]|uniref:hypothetical protein n=1 Tax=Archangium sp. TaxID=1872627 RepID=UPI002D576630|nr:hypothetical protein [Archangium sp.]HYO51202.1 hypothetical protein [Archangium sp.]
MGLTVGLVVAGVVGPLPLPALAQEIPPNAVFLMDNSESMQDYLEYLSEAFTPGYYPTPTNPGSGDLGGEGSAGRAINTGCSDPALVQAMRWFNKDSADPSLNGSIPYDSDPDLGSPFFEPNKFYTSRGRRLAWSVKDFPYSIDPSFMYLSGHSDTLSACYNAVYWDTTSYPYSPMSPVIQECMSCLSSKGWWRGPLVTSNTPYPQNTPIREPGEPPLPPEAYRKWVLSGRVLNVRPPKFAMVRRVLKDVIRTAPAMRLSVATFGKDHGWFDPPELIEPLRPSCDMSYPTVNESALNRPLLMQAVNRVRFVNPERSIGEALFGLGGYFSSQKADNQWENWFKQPLSPGWGWPGCCNGGTYDDPYTGREGLYWGVTADEWVKRPTTDPTTGVYLPGQPWEDVASGRRSVCFGTQRNGVIVVSDGSPRSDNTVPITRMMELLLANGARHPDGSLLTFNPINPETNPSVGGVNYCDQFMKREVYPVVEYFTKADCDYTDYNWPAGLGVGNKNFMDDVAFFLSRTDLRGDMPGLQTVRTYVVGYNDSSPMLQSIARAGQGYFYRSNNVAELRDALRHALNDLRSSTGSTP